MSKLRMLFAIPCFALAVALVGCGKSESTFTPVETPAAAPTEANYTGGTDPTPQDGGGAAEAPAPEGGSGEAN